MVYRQNKKGIWMHYEEGTEVWRGMQEKKRQREEQQKWRAWGEEQAWNEAKGKGKGRTKGARDDGGT